MNKEQILEFLRSNPNADISQIAANFSRPNPLTLSQLLHGMVRAGQLAKQVVKTDDGKRFVQYRLP